MSKLVLPSEPAWVRRFKSVEMAVLFLLWAVVAVLDMKRMRFGIVTDYGADVFTPAWLYVCTREGKTILRKAGLRIDRPFVVAGCIFALCVGWETGQKFRLIPGTFDPLDIVAYGAGVGGALLIDLWLVAKGKASA